MAQNLYKFLDKIIFKKKRMALSVYKLLHVDSKDEVDEAAVIQAAQQNPKDLDRTFEFCRGGHI
eukprot:3256171-Ditylum_brightwellii.AAC.1